MTETWKVVRSEFVKTDKGWQNVETVIATGVSKAEADRLLAKDTNRSATPEHA